MNSFPRVQLRRVATIVNGGTPSADSLNWNGDVPWATPVDLGKVDGGSIQQTERGLTEIGVSTGSVKVPAGCVLLSSRAPIGYLATNRVPMAFNQGCKAIVPRDVGTDPRFLRYALESVKHELHARGRGSTFVELNATELAEVLVPYPSAEEQRRIADYLDHETAEVDAFVKDQERLTSLLLERSYAALVRKVAGADLAGGNSDVNGVPWAPGVVTPYRIANIRRVAAMRTGHTPSRQRPDYWVNTEIDWFTLADVWQLRAGRKYLGETKEKISKVGLENSAADLLPEGTVVLSRTASVGFTGIMPRAMATSQDYWNWVCGPDILPEYLWYQFRAMRPEFERIKSGSTHKTIYQADAAGMRIVVPPVQVQADIVAELTIEGQKLEETIQDSARTIELLKERRAALISAAVTGKLDVTSKEAVA